jgi:hypothetical protein
MNRSALINRIKIKMDEFTPSGVALPFDEYIGPILDDSAISLIKVSPLHLLTPTPITLTSETGPSLVSLVKYAGDKSYIPVPVDYVRLYEIKYPLWKRSVRKAIPVESQAYRPQENEYLKGGYGRPFVAIVQTSVSGEAATRYFECSKVIEPANDETLTPIALYVKKTAPEDLNDSLADALTWLCTSNLLMIMGYADKAKMALEKYTASLTMLANS